MVPQRDREPLRNLLFYSGIQGIIRDLFALHVKRDVVAAMLKNGKAGFLFVLPALVLYLLFLIVPYTLAFGVSFMHWRGVALNMHFSGLDNFARMIGDPNFWKALRNTVFFKGC